MMETKGLKNSFIKKNILLCDDQRNLRELLSLSLSDTGYDVTGVANGAQALNALAQGEFDLVITDLKLPDMSGLEILRHAKKIVPERPVVLITAYASTETAVTAMKEGAFDYLEKPFPVEQLHLVVARALEQGELRRENSQLRQQLQERSDQRAVVGNSEKMRHVLEIAARVARTDATVLITGESGTGKELIARYIHDHSQRAKGAFLAINCAAIPENLIESELFGHTKGAFSGATQNRKGVFVEAEGGTLLLDEIGEMPLNTQVKLLRVLQERAVRPVGSSSGEKAVNVRLLVTTNRDMAKEVALGRFREDLYYRIQVVNLELPPLRERPEDIPVLALRFLEIFAKRYDLPIHKISPQAMACLVGYSFPGNVRELENVIEGAVSLTTGEMLELASFPLHVRQPRFATHSELSSFELPEEGLDLEGLLANIESQAIRQAMERVSGNKTQAAHLLGLTFRSFRYRCAKVEGGEEK
ncbi:MAG: sigma-54 dependent transcriptional regulator [Magnetococcus sp. DMHC-6]